MNGRKRTVQIKFRVTEEERAFIEQKMQLVPTRNMSTRKVRDEYGNVYYGIDEDMRDRLQAKLMRAVLDYKID